MAESNRRLAVRTFSASAVTYQARMISSCWVSYKESHSTYFRTTVVTLEDVLALFDRGIVTRCLPPKTTISYVGIFAMTDVVLCCYDVCSASSNLVLQSEFNRWVVLPVLPMSA